MKRSTAFDAIVLLMVTLGAFHGAGRSLASERFPGTLLLDGRCLARTRASLAEDDSSPRAALAKLVREAEAALTVGPFSVTDKAVPPPSGDKHDYASFGVYWWPNPDTQDGLPYVGRDGRTNPASRRGDRCDTPRLSAMARSVETLALAYYFTGQEKYAARAALLLRTWFLEPETRMNPHLQYAQAIPGLVEGRGYGIIDTVSLLKVVDAAILLEDSPSWHDKEHGALKQWFGDYLGWLRTSRHGIDESRTRNNHGTWYDVQVAQFALFVGDRKTAAATIKSAKKNRVLHQISPGGRQKRELARTRSFHYSLYNLAGLFSLARLGEHVGVDLWHVEVKGKPALQAALDYLAPYADAEKPWPHKQITKSRRNTPLIGLLRRGYLVYQKPKYLEMLGKCPEKIRLEDRSALLYSQPREEAMEQATLKPVGFPGREWHRADAKELRFDTEILNRITAKMKEAKANGVLVRDGYLIAQWNFGGPPEKRFDIQSCTKSITSLAVGGAIMDGRIPHVDVLVKDYWPDFEAGPYTDKITFRHLLTMTAGIVQTTRYGTGQDKQLPAEPAEPGTRYNYLNDQSKALAGALTYLYRRELGDVMNETLNPLGISMEWGSEARWDPDVVTADGRTIRRNCGYSRARFSASDLARVGHLYLQKGLWKDKRIISEKYVEESLTPCGISAGPRREVGDDGLILTGGYGFKWRQHEYNGVTTWGMHGYGHQFCVIIPEYDVVMTKLSNWRDKSTWIGCETFYPLLIRSLK